jgi:hypothetical protein
MASSYDNRVEIFSENCIDAVLVAMSENDTNF